MQTQNSLTCKQTSLQLAIVRNWKPKWLEHWYFHQLKSGFKSVICYLFAVVRQYEISVYISKH